MKQRKHTPKGPKFYKGVMKYYILNKHLYLVKYIFEYLAIVQIQVPNLIITNISIVCKHTLGR